MLVRLTRRLVVGFVVALAPIAAQVAPPAPVAPPAQAAAPAAGPLVGPIEYLWPSTSYPDGAPLAVGTDEIDRPNLSLYLASGEGAKPAIVVCPGGGYGGLAKAHE
ncbi:MAG: Acetylxylan esterase precursor, partial [Planctomycetota bacterium]